MNTKAVVCTVMTLSLSLSQVAFAQRNDSGPDFQQGRHHRPNRPPNIAQQDERGAGPEHQFHRGERLPLEYRHRNYVVNDWRAHQLSAPPHGYHWVQIGSDYVLVAIATGLILQLMLSN